VNGNAYWDGNWWRFDVGQPSTSLIATGSGSILFNFAPAGSNPISTWTTVLQATSGGVAVTGTLGATGALGLAGRAPASAAAISVPNTNGAATLDNSGGSGQAGQSIANNGYWEPLGSVMNFSGMLIFNETIAYGYVAIFLAGAGTTSVVSQHPAGSTGFSSVGSTAGKINIYYGPSNQILVQNLSGATINLSCMAFRTRYSA